MRSKQDLKMIGGKIIIIHIILILLLTLFSTSRVNSEDGTVISNPEVSEISTITQTATTNSQDAVLTDIEQQINSPVLEIPTITQTPTTNSQDAVLTDIEQQTSPEVSEISTITQTTISPQNTTQTENQEFTTTVNNLTNSSANIITENPNITTLVQSNSSSSQLIITNYSFIDNSTSANNSDNLSTVPQINEGENNTFVNEIETKTEDTAFIEYSISPENTYNSGSSDYIYVPIENYTKTNETENINYSEKSKDKKIFTIRVYGKTEIRGDILESFDTSSIETIEEILADGSKELTVKSENHLESPLEVYTDIPPTNVAEKDKITIFWVNENKTITPDSIYDSDNDGLLDRISWTVPHLSEQKFKISIDFQINNESNENNSQEINLTTISAPNGIVSNPITFSFNINYSHPESLTCQLFIGAYYSPLNIMNNTDVYYNNLPNDNYNWYLECSDENQSKTARTETKSFIINESFSISTDQKVYILGEPVLVNINSNKNLNAIINLYSPSENKNFSVPNNSNNYLLNLTKDNFTVEGLYKIEATSNTLAEPYTVQSNFSIIKASITLSNASAKIGEEIKISTEISSPVEKITSLIVDFGDGSSNITYFNINENNKSVEFKHKYSQENNYTIKLNLVVGGRNFVIQKNGINITRNLSIDLERPIISLIYPSDNSILNSSSLTFSYSASDNIKLANCTLEIYNNTGILGILNYSKTELNPSNVTKNISLGLSEGDYSWIVECYDNSSNNQYSSKDFRISFQSNQNNSTTPPIMSASKANKYISNTQLEKINNAIASLNSFLTKKDSYDIYQKQALDDLGISKDLDYYNKRLIQINQDLTNNVAFIQNNVTRQERIQQLLGEVENISREIPIEVEIIDKNEFVKNSVSNDLENILSKYTIYQKLSLNKNQIKDLAKKNLNIQKYLSTSTKVKQVRIKYNDTQKEITLVTKTLSIKNDSSDSRGDILEIIPKEIYSDKVVFINKKTNIDDSIFEVLKDDLKDQKITYYTMGFIDLKKVEQTDTLYYQEFPIDSIRVTGLSIFSLGDTPQKDIYYLIAIAIIIGILLLLYAIKKIKIGLWKKDEKVLKLVSLIGEAKRTLSANDYISAKERYSEIKNIYPTIPAGCKKYLYKDIEIIRNNIDKKEISNLLKEYNEAKKQNRDNDAKLIYENIKMNYKKLPKKYQEKVYKTLFESSFE